MSKKNNKKKDNIKKEVNFESIRISVYLPDGTVRQHNFFKTGTVSNAAEIIRQEHILDGGSLKINHQGTIFTVNFTNLSETPEGVELYFDGGKYREQQLTQQQQLNQLAPLSQQQQTQQNIDIQDIVLHLQDLKIQNERIEHGLKNMGNRLMEIQSDTALGTTALNNLLPQYRITFVEISGKEPILTREEMEEYSNISRENDFVKALTTHFQNIFIENDLVVVNSENFAWLETGNDPNKPDLFLAPNWVYTKKIPKAIKKNEETKDDEKVDEHNYLYGVVESQRLYDCLYLLDCKMKFSNAAFGELLKHVRFLNEFSGIQSKQSKAMLFDKSGCYMIIVQGHELIYYEFVPWDAGGSRERLKEFYNPIKWNITPFLQEFSISVDEPKEAGDSAFLGSGAFGRVIRVVNQDNEKFALKVVDIKDYSNVHREFSILKNHMSCGCHLIASVPDISEVKTKNELCGYLISPVGVGLSRQKLTKSLINPVINLLSSLHLHNPPYVHGDARIANIIQIDGNLSWIDFRNSSPTFSEYGAKCDMKTLINSILPQIPINDSLLDEYARNLSNIENIINFIEQYFQT